MIFQSQEILIALTLASIPAILGIYLFFVLKKERLALASLLLSAFLLRLLIISLDPFLHDWDERFHALVAKNMILHPFIPMLRIDPVMAYDPSAWCCNHIWLHKQPLFLWQMAASMKLFGVHVFALRFPSALLGTATVFFTYDIARHWTKNTQVAFLSAMLLTFSFYQLELMSGRLKLDHNDFVFMFYITATIWAFVRYIKSHYSLKWAIIVGLLVGCSILVKWLTGFLIFGGWGLYLLQNHVIQYRIKKLHAGRRESQNTDANPHFIRSSNAAPTVKDISSSINATGSQSQQHTSPDAQQSRINGPEPESPPYIHLAVSFLVSCIVFLPWQFYIQNDFPLESALSYAHNWQHVTEALGGHQGNAWFHLEKLSNIYGALFIPFLAMGLISLIRRKEIDRTLSISFYAMIFVVYTFFSLFVATKMIAFTFIASPLIFILIAYGLTWFYTYMITRFSISTPGKITLYLMLLFLIAGAYSLKPWSISKYRSQDNTERSAKMYNTLVYQSLDDSICQNYIVLNCKSFEDVELMFYKDVNAYHWFPKAHIIDSLENLGYRFAAFQSHTNQGLPGYILNNDEILIIDKEIK